ncbi:MAG: nucleotidyltransferase family protein [Thermoplasmata archaeon]|nr:nucleotidyltransferase family protein [Thermoplasmata archaeon]
METIALPLLHCYRCGNSWTPRKATVRMCPLCKSRLWDVPRPPVVTPFDPENPFWRTVVEPNRRRIVAITRKYRARNVRVFGSVRRGSATARSDLDLLVTFEGDASLFDQIRLRAELEKLVRRKVDVLSDQGIFWLIRPQILAEAIPL